MKRAQAQWSNHEQWLNKTLKLELGEIVTTYLFCLFEGNQPLELDQKSSQTDENIRSMFFLLNLLLTFSTHYFSQGRLLFYPPLNRPGWRIFIHEGSGLLLLLSLSSFLFAVWPLNFENYKLTQNIFKITYWPRNFFWNSKFSPWLWKL